MPANNDLGTSFGDFLVDLVGGNSKVKMAGTAAVEGLDSKSKLILDQIKDKIQQHTEAGPEPIDTGESATLSTASDAAGRYKNKLRLLNTLQDFYTKQYGTGTK